MSLTHPLASRDAAPAAVTAPDGATYPVRDDGRVDCPADAEAGLADALADAHDVDVDALRADVSDDTCDDVKDDGEVCGRPLPCQYHTESDAED